MKFKRRKNKLVFENTFKDFKEAFSFLEKVACLAEKHDHHPEIYNCYNKIKLCLSTHEKGNVVTKKDLFLAKQIESFFKS